MQFLEIVMHDQDCYRCEQGPQGIQGPQGVQGVQGAQGVAGKDCCCEPHHPKEHCKIEFAECYSLLSQNLAQSNSFNTAGQTVLLENTIHATAGIDTSLAASTGAVKINAPGWYDVVTGICAALNPISSPLPVWTLSLFKNGIIVPGSTFANMTLSPEQKANEIVADVFLYLAAGDVITLANTSTASILLSSANLGSNAQPNSAFMKILLLKAD